MTLDKAHSTGLYITLEMTDGKTNITKVVKMINLSAIKTEMRNENSMQIHKMSTIDILKVINNEDKKVALAVEEQLPQIQKAVDVIYDKLHEGGRLIYSGCGTSGRLGVLDAVECPPTYNTDYETVQAVMAGGEKAFVKAVEGAEDDVEMGAKDLQRINFTNKDVLVGLSASGRTPYVLGAMEYAKSTGAPVIAVTCCPQSEMDTKADIGIAVYCGPEVVTGSTRMKSGTAQKLVLNMLSTAVMIKLGKVYENLMVDVKATNKKLVERSIKIVCEATGAQREKVIETLAQCGQSAKTAIVMLLLEVNSEKASALLIKADGHIDRAIG